MRGRTFVLILQYRSYQEACSYSYTNQRQPLAWIDEAFAERLDWLADEVEKKRTYAAQDQTCSRNCSRGFAA